MAMSLRVSPVSRTASLLIIGIGVFTVLVGWVTGILEDTVAGTAFIILGVVLWRLLYVLGGKTKGASEQSRINREAAGPT